MLCYISIIRLTVKSVEFLNLRCKQWHQQISPSIYMRLKKRSNDILDGILFHYTQRCKQTWSFYFIRQPYRERKTPADIALLGSLRHTNHSTVIRWWPVRWGPIIMDRWTKWSTCVSNRAVARILHGWVQAPEVWVSRGVWGILPQEILKHQVV